MSINKLLKLLTGPPATACSSATILIAVILAAAPAAAQIGVSPPRTEFSLDGPTKTHTIRVFNVGDKAVDIAVQVNHWDLDEENQVRILPPTEQSLDQWLVINPLEFTLEAGGSQAVRFAARPRVEPEPGEHRAMVFFQQQPDAEMLAHPDQPRILFQLGTSVIGLAEPVIREAVVHAVTADARGVSVEIESRGNTHVRLDGQWAVWSTGAFPGHDRTTPVEGLGEDESIVLPEGMVAAWPLTTLPVLPGTRRVITSPFPAALDPGRYVLDLHGTIAGVDLGRSFEFEVPPTIDETAPGGTTQEAPEVPVKPTETEQPEKG